MSEEKLMPDVRFEGFSGEWETHNLKDVADIIGGGTPSTSIPEYWNGHIDWYSPVEIGNKNFVEGSQNKITTSGLEGSSAKVLPIGTILFTSRAGIGKTAILAKEGATNQGFQSIVPYKNVLDSYFMYSMTNELKRYGEKKGAGSTFVEVSGKQMEKMPLVIPRLKEQQGIGEFFKTVDNQLQVKLAEIKKITQYKQAMLQKMFPEEGESVPEIRFEGFEGEWKPQSLGDSGHTFTGLSGKSGDDFGHGDGRFVTYMNVFKNTVSDLNAVENVEVDKTQNEVKQGDVFFTTSSETPEDVGMSSVWKHNQKNVYLNSFCFGYRPTETFDLDFLAFFLRSPAIRTQFKFLAQGISRYNISKTKAMNIEISIPSSEEQILIGAYFTNLQKNLDSKQAELKKLKQFKQAMLDKLFV